MVVSKDCSILGGGGATVLGPVVDLSPLGTIWARGTVPGVPRSFRTRVGVIVE